MKTEKEREEKTKEKIKEKMKEKTTAVMMWGRAGSVSEKSDRNEFT